MTPVSARRSDQPGDDKSEDARRKRESGWVSENEVARMPFNPLSNRFLDRADCRADRELSIRHPLLPKL